MKQNCTVSVWCFLSLVVVLFCLSILAPREWSSWDARPVGPASCALPGDGPNACSTQIDPACDPLHGDGDARPARPAYAPFVQGACADLADCTDSDSAHAWMDEPCPAATPLATAAQGRAECAWQVADRRDCEATRPPVDIGASVERPYDITAKATLHDNDGPGLAARPGLTQPLGQEPMEAAVLPGLSPARRPAPASVLVPAWPTASALLAQLDALSVHASCHHWCLAVQTRLENLAEVDSLAASAAATRVSELQTLATEAMQALSVHPAPQVRSEWARVVFALRRRLAIWEQVCAIAARGPVVVADGDAAGLRQAYEALASRLRGSRDGEIWARCLQMSAAGSQFLNTSTSDTGACRELAKQIMLQIDDSALSPTQQRFLQEPVCRAYLQHVRRLAVEPVDYSRLLAELEQYEQDPSAGASLRIAAAQKILCWSDDTVLAELGRRLDVNYRNANLRIAVSRSFMERLLPPPAPVAEPVDAIIQGAYTTGHSETLTELGVRLIPSPNSWRIGLTAEGEVASETRSNSGSATFHSCGNSVFAAAKEIVVHRHGLYHRAAVADAESSTELAGVSTRLDSVPLIGELARAIALDRYQNESPATERAVRRRIAASASDRIDTEVAARLEEVQKRFLNHFYSPLRQLALNPLVTDMATNEAEVVARLRLASHHQLAAHTPRPVTPPGSVFHLQAHESAVNNVLDQLNWEGRRANVRDLWGELAATFQLARPELPEDLPEDVHLKFADRTPLRVTFQQDRLTFELALAELAQGTNRWRDFTVRVHYRPAVEQPGADLVRDQYVELIGNRLHLRDQVALRGVFSRVFAQNKPIQLVSQSLHEDARLAGLEVSHLRLNEGWFSLALGEPSTSNARRPIARRDASAGAVAPLADTHPAQVSRNRTYAR